VIGWTVRKAARSLVAGEQFVFDEKYGGENQILTVESVREAFGTVTVSVEEFDWELAFDHDQSVTLVTQVDPAPEQRVIQLTFEEYTRITGGEPPRLHKPPRMMDNLGRVDGVFEFYDTHIEGSSMEVVPQQSGNVEITVSFGPDDGYLFTLHHCDRADLIRALLHDFHYSPEKDGPNDDDR
jgi:hypothetical protein